VPESFSVVPCVHLLLRSDGKVLLARRHNTGYEDGKWSVPAGHLDGGESVREAAVREAAEEIGVALAVADLRVDHVMHRRKADEERVDFFVTCTSWNGDVRNNEPDKCSELAWADPANLPDDTIAYVRSGIGRTIAGVTYSEFGWEPPRGAEDPAPLLDGSGATTPS
jgi:8-oxo-dGTP pyrophosphatase MutT (NUDIX family)